MMRLNKEERGKRVNQFLIDEESDNKEKCLWMSFCDPNKPKRKQFLGVIIIKTLGFTHAVIKTHRLGINPGGEIQLFELSEDAQKDIKSEDFNRLLSKTELEEAGYIGEKK